jgi:hypothetical protein
MIISKKILRFSLLSISQGWKEKHNQGSFKEEALPETQECSVNDKKQKSTWAQLIKKVYGTDPLVCPRCGSEMKIIAIIMDHVETMRILEHLAKMGSPTPRFDTAS